MLAQVNAETKKPRGLAGVFNGGTTHLELT